MCPQRGDALEYFPSSIFLWLYGTTKYWVIDMFFFWVIDMFFLSNWYVFFLAQKIVIITYIWYTKYQVLCNLLVLGTIALLLRTSQDTCCKFAKLQGEEGTPHKTSSDIRSHAIQLARRKEIGHHLGSNSRLWRHHYSTFRSADYTIGAGQEAH